LIFVVLFSYLVIGGGEIKRNMVAGPCSVEYKYFLTNNVYCNWATAGHCADNFLESANARRKLGICLCEKEEIQAIRKELIKLIKSDPILSNDFSTLMHLNPTTDSLKIICNHKVSLFKRLYLD